MTKNNEMAKDWKGNIQSIHICMGSRNYAIQERQSQDFYATNPKALKLLLEIEYFDKIIPVWECACGAGHLSKLLIEKGYDVKSSDLFDRGYGKTGINFLAMENQEWNGNIITNPPFIYATEFIYKALQIIPVGNKFAVFLPIRYLEGVSRGQIFKNFPPRIIYVPSRRLKCARNGEFEKMKGSALSFAWYVWHKGFKGTTELKWFN